MNGWQRIGVVLAVLFGIPAFFIAYSEYDSAYGSVTPSESVKALKGQEFWNALYSQAESSDPGLYDGCVPSTIRMQAPYSEYDSSYSVSCDKSREYAVIHSLPWALLPGVIFWIIGMTVAWVIAGFRGHRR